MDTSTRPTMKSPSPQSSAFLTSSNARSMSPAKSAAPRFTTATSSPASTAANKLNSSPSTMSSRATAAGSTPGRMSSAPAPLATAQSRPDPGRGQHETAQNPGAAAKQPLFLPAASLHENAPRMGAVFPALTGCTPRYLFVPALSFIAWESKSWVAGGDNELCKPG